jgi:hypothetical protein
VKWEADGGSHSPIAPIIGANSPSPSASRSNTTRTGRAPVRSSGSLPVRFSKGIRASAGEAAISLSSQSARRALGAEAETGAIGSA